jgi:hypothetical protein
MYMNYNTFMTIGHQIFETFFMKNVLEKNFFERYTR